MRALLALSAALVVAASPAAAREFVVRSSLGAPLAGVRAVVFDERHQVDLPISALSGPDGRLSLDLPAAAKIRLELWGYAFWVSPSPAGPGPSTLVVPYRRQPVAVMTEGPSGTTPPGVAVPWVAQTPAGASTSLQGLVPPSGVTELALPDRPWKLQFLLGGGSAEVFVRDGSPARVRFAMRDVVLTFSDRAGKPAVDLDVEVLPAGSDVVIARWRSDAAGTARGALVPAAYRLRWRLGTRVVGELPLTVEASAVARRIPVDLHPVTIKIGAGEGGMPERAMLVLAGDGVRIERPLLAAQTLPLPVGRFTPEVRAGGFDWPLTPFEVPAGADVVRGLDMAPLKVRVVDAASRRPFGAVLVGAGPGPGAPAPDRWTDVEGAAVIVAPPGSLLVTAAWFGVTSTVSAVAPGSVELPLALPMRSFDAPPEHPEAPLVRLEREGFAAWVAAMPGGGFELPLPAGRYRAVLHDAAQRPLVDGTLTAIAAEPLARPSWAGAAAGPARARRLVWPRALAPTPPSVERKEGERWLVVEVGPDGELPVLADGAELRVPAGAVGTSVRVEGDEIAVELGRLELVLPRPGRAKLFDPAASQRQVVVDCPDGRCRAWLPAGTWQVFAPGTQLLPAPIELEAGRSAERRLEPL